MAGVLGPLQDRSLSLSDRLEVACCLWGHDERRKGVILLEWACQELCQAYNKKVKRPPPPATLAKLWKFLGNVLKSLAQDGSPRDFPSLNKYLFQGMGVVFCSGAGEGQDDDQMTCVRECVGCLYQVFQLPKFPAALGVFEIVVGLLESILTLCVASFSHAHQQGPESGLLQCLQCGLEYYSYLESVQGNPKKVFTSTCQQLLCPALRLHSLLGTQAIPYQESVAKVIGGIENIFKSLFRSEILSEFSSTLSSAADKIKTTPTTKTAISSTRILFDVLDQLLQSEHSQSGVVALPLLLGAFLQENSVASKVPKTIEFNFFLRVLQMLGVIEDWAVVGEKAAGTSDTDTDTSTDPSDEDLRQVLRQCFRKKRGKRPSNTFLSLLPRVTAYQQCLQLVLQYQVYQVTEDMNSDQRQTRCFKFLVRGIMRELRPSSLSLYSDCLCVMLTLNHLLLEPWLPVIWGVASSETSSHTDKLMVSCIETYSRLRQLPVLLEKQLAVSSLLGTLWSSTDTVTPSPPSPSAITPSPLLPCACKTVLAAQLPSLPPGQATDLLSLYTHHLQQLLDHAPLVGVGVCQSVQVLCVLLSRLPLVVWTGRGRGVALQLTCTLVEEVCDKMLVVARTELEDPTPTATPTLATAALLLVCGCRQLLTRLWPRLPPSVSLPRFPEGVELHVTTSRQLLPGHWVGVASSQQPAMRFLLHQLAIYQWRTECLDAGREGEGVQHCSASDLLDFIFQPEEETPGLQEEWNGQAVSLVADNYGVGYCWLVLTHLPLLYESCEERHLRGVANLILTSLALPTDHTPKESQGVELVGVVSSFLESESFPEMRRLHEALFCQYLSPIKGKSLPQALKRVLKLCGEESADALRDGCATALSQAVEWGLGDGLGHTCAYSYHKLKHKWKLGVYLKLVTAFPLASMKVPLALRSLLMGLLYHLALLHLLISTVSCESADSSDEEREDMFLSLTELSYLLAWQLHSLLTASVFRRKVRSTCVGMEQLGLLLSWWYHVATQLCTINPRAQVCDAVVSMMVAMEVTLAMQLTYHSYPQGFASEVQTIVELVADLGEPGKAWLSGQTLVVLLDAISSHHPGGMEDHAPLSALSKAVLDSIERVLASPAPSALFSAHPHLVSLLARLTTLDPSLRGTSARQLAEQVWVVGCGQMQGEEEEERRNASDEDWSLLQRYDRFCGILDCFTVRLTTVLAPPSATPSDTPESDNGGMELARTGIGTSLQDICSLAREAASDICDMLEAVGVPIFNRDVLGYTIPEIMAMKTRECQRRGGALGGGARLRESTPPTDMDVTPPTTPSTERDATLPTERNGMELSGGMELGSGTEEETGTSLASLWTVIQQILSDLLAHLDEGGVEPVLTHLLAVGTKGSATPTQWGERKSQETVFGMMLDKVCQQMCLVLKSSSRKEVDSIVQGLDELPPLPFCVCWLVLLDSKLPQDVRLGARPRLQQLLLTCSEMAEQHATTSHTHFLVVLALQVAATVLSIPSHVGVDREGAVLTGLQLCCISSSLYHLHSHMALRCMEVTGQLLAAVLRQHSSVVDHSPAPFLTATNYLIGGVVSCGQKVMTEADSPLLPPSLHCAVVLARVLEVLSHHKTLYRFFPSLVHGYLASSQKGLVHEEVKVPVESGVCYLLQQCAAPQLAFLKASLDPSSRQALLSLTQHFHTAFKFANKI